MLLPKRATSLNYVKLLKKDTGLDDLSEIRTVMEDRDDVISILRQLRTVRNDQFGTWYTYWLRLVHGLFFGVTSSNLFFLKNRRKSLGTNLQNLGTITNHKQFRLPCTVILYQFSNKMDGTKYRYRCKAKAENRLYYF